jgi:hypothetical protein
VRPPDRRDAIRALNYGFARPRFDDAEELSGLTARLVPEHNVNVWLRKDCASGFNAAFGTCYLGSQFVNDSNTVTLDAYTIFSGAIGYHANRLVVVAERRPTHCCR